MAWQDFSIYKMAAREEGMDGMCVLERQGTDTQLKRELIWTSN